MINDNKIKEFIKKINKNAPLSSYSNNNINLKFPYKPALIISIIENTNIDDLFNHDISLLKNQKIVKSYYDILMSSETLCNAFKEMKGKTNWSIGYNENTFKRVISNIFENPAKKLIINNNNIWEINIKDKTIKINYDFQNNEDKLKLRKILLDVCYSCLRNCIPEYKNLSHEEIFNYENFIYQEILTIQNDSEPKRRQYQHIFAKVVKDRDGGCVICNIDLPEILEACHIKPFTKCKTQAEQYSEENGLTMCKNHHKLFDDGFFSFSNEWDLIINNKYFRNHQLEIITNYYDFYKNLKNIKPYNNAFMKYHRNEIFRK